MAAATMAAIETCDLIVDATADPGVFNLCSAIARRAKKPCAGVMSSAVVPAALLCGSGPGLDQRH